MKEKKIYILYLLISIVMFSTSEVVSKPITGTINASILTFYRFFIGGIVLLPFGMVDFKRHHVCVTGTLLLQFLSLGILLVVVSMTLCQIGLQMCEASVVAVLYSLNPIFLSFFSVYILKEKLTRRKKIGLLIGVIGVIVSCLHLFIGEFKVGMTYILGIVLVVLAMFALSLYTIFTKKISRETGSCGCVSLNSILGSFILLLFIFFTGAKKTNPLYFDVKSIWPQFLYICIFVTGVAYYLFYNGIAHLNTSVSSMIFFLKPPLASLFASIFLHEKITVNIIIGIILIFCGVGISRNNNIWNKTYESLKIL